MIIILTVNIYLHKEEEDTMYSRVWYFFLVVSEWKRKYEEHTWKSNTELFLGTAYFLWFHLIFRHFHPPVFSEVVYYPF